MSGINYRNTFLRALIFIGALCTHCAVKAQWVQTTGPLGAVAFMVQDTSLFAADGGVLRASTDGGGWRWSSVGLPPGCSVEAFVQMGGNLFAATADDGIYVSSDHGNNWSESWPSMGRHFYSLAALGNDLFAGMTWGGIARSTDSGKSWEYLTNGLAEPKFQSCPGVYSLLARDSVLFAGTKWGVYKTVDHGDTWQAMNNGLPDFTDVEALAMVRGLLFAGTNGHGIYRSSDGGGAWVNVSAGLTDSTIYSLLAIDSAVFSAVRYSGVFRTTNFGSEWLSVSKGLPSTSMTIGSMVVSNTFLFAGSNAEGGIWRRPLSELRLPISVEMHHALESSIRKCPNPFTRTTTISFPADGGHADVSIVNQLGIEVARLFSGELEAGEHSYAWDASGMPAGMYECLIRTGGKVEKAGMLLVR